MTTQLTSVDYGKAAHHAVTTGRVDTSLTAELQAYQRDILEAVTAPKARQAIAQYAEKTYLSGRPQAERATDAQVDLHIQRQHALGERMIGDNDRPRWPEMLATGVLLVAALGWAYVRYSNGLPPF